jgi:hypothetical protein
MRIGIDARVLFGPHTGDRTYLLNLLRQFAAMDLPHEFLLFTDRFEPPSLGARGEGRGRGKVFLPTLGSSDCLNSLAGYTLAFCSREPAPPTELTCSMSNTLRP